MRGRRATGDPTDLEIGRAHTELGSKNEDGGWGNWSSIPRRSSSRTGGGRQSLIRSTRQELTAGEMRLGVRGRSISRQEVFRGKWSPTED